MANRAFTSSIRISTKQMKQAIERSGYLLEQRVEPILREADYYYVQTNTAYPDPETGKSREIDISALSSIWVFKKGFHKTGYHAIYPYLLCECENNFQPIVFFMKESDLPFLHHWEIKASGIPAKFWGKDGYVSLSEFTGMEKFHHYCKGPIATQYCTFQPKKDQLSWLAFHGDEQHDTFNALIRALEYEIGRHFDGWTLPDEVDEEEVNIQIYYPVVVLQGDLYSAFLEGSRFTLRRSKHIQFRKELYLPRTNKVETYQIDVISEEYLRDYLKIIESEMLKVKKALQRQREKVLLSIEKIVEEAKGLKGKPDSYRKYLEF